MLVTGRRHQPCRASYISLLMSQSPPGPIDPPVALRGQPAPLSGVWQQLPDPVIVVNADWQVTSVNVAARSLVDAPPVTSEPDATGSVAEGRNTMVGRSVLGILPTRQAATVERALHEAGRLRRSVRHELHDPEGGAGHVAHVTVTPQDDHFWIILHCADLQGTDFPALSADHNARVMRELIAAGISLAGTHALDQLLQTLVDVARELVGARYAALGIVNEAGTGLSDFITSGLTPQQRARIGELPAGHGILGLVVREARPLRLADLREHEASVGMPAHHPAMRSFMGVPVVAAGRVFGNLYLTEKSGEGDFTAQDQALAQTLAAQAAVAIENAELRRERDRFFAAASHELGNALAGLTLWARHLVRQPPETNQEWQQGVRNILTGAEQTTRLIEDLLSLSKLREGRLTLDAWDVSVVAAADDAITQLTPEAEAAGVRLRLDATAHDAHLISDAVRLRQILANLLVNAIKFSPAGSEVVIGAEPGATAAAVEAGHGLAPVRGDGPGTDDGPAGDGALLWVRDEGPGIPEDERERIFRPYEQIAQIARGRGSGLGLALSRQLARLMGGDLWVERAPTGGALFKLRLPARLPERSELPYDKR